MQNLDVPAGGCLKNTSGIYQQAFDKDGKLVASQFEAGCECEYISSDGIVLNSEDPRCNFYHPFDTTGPIIDITSPNESLAG